MGIEGLELKGFAAVGRMLAYLTVVQALLLLLILVVVISK